MLSYHYWQLGKWAQCCTASNSQIDRHVCICRMSNLTISLHAVWSNLQEIRSVSEVGKIMWWIQVGGNMEIDLPGDLSPILTVYYQQHFDHRPITFLKYLYSNSISNSNSKSKSSPTATETYSCGLNTDYFDFLMHYEQQCNYRSPRHVNTLSRDSCMQ